MAKSRAEIQKKYRERKKAKEGKKYLERETTRVKKYYVKTTDLNPRKLKEKRERTRNCMRKKRLEEKQAGEIFSNSQQEQDYESQEHSNKMKTNNGTVSEEELGPCDSINSIHPSTSHESADTSLIVKMKFNNTSNKKREGKAYGIAKKKIAFLEAKLNRLAHKNDALRKILSRQTQKNNLSMKKGLDKNLDTDISRTDTENNATNVENTTGAGSNKTSCERKRKCTTNENDLSVLTPKSRSKEELRREGLSPSKYPKIVKKLSFHNSLVNDLNESIKETRGRRRERSVIQSLSGKLIKRYRMRSWLRKAVEVSHRSIYNETSKNPKVKYLKRKALVTKVVTFLEREDNSSCLPGKRDALKCKTEKLQVRVLSDYLYNLHLKFKSEFPETNVSLTTFSSCRPKNIKLLHFSSRKTCLCQKHQNMALKVKALKQLNITTTKSPDVLIKNMTDEDILDSIDSCESSTFAYSEWRRKEVEHKGKITKRMQIEVIEKPKDEFKELMKKELMNFRLHTKRVATQYEQFKLLKETIPEHHIICQMDFAENYTCSHADEVQSAYFDKGFVTLHPVVTYFKNHENELKHKSYIYVSDTPSHTAGTVYAFLKSINEILVKEHDNVECIHYITDSPTSQYRNKHMMNVVGNHDKLFGIQASWQYFEAGHGKGACDGIGGTAKRMADTAVKRHAVVIQNAEDFFKWGSSQTQSPITYMFVPKVKCDQAQEELTAMNAKPVKGTMEIHSVVQVDTAKIAVRDTSCFCPSCFIDGEFKMGCSGWILHNLTSVADNKTQNTEPAIDNVAAITVKHVANAATTYSKIPVNTFVAAIYNGKWYVGKVLEYDQDDNEYNITFMQEGSSKLYVTFKWPAKDDVLWVHESSVLCTVDDPVPYGKRKMYKLSETDMNMIVSKFELSDLRV